MILVEIKDLNVFIGNKPFFHQLVKIKQKVFKDLLKCQKIMTIQQEIY